MPHFICRWPGGDVLLASVESRQELDAILQERCEPGVCKVARYHGPLVLELKPDIPGVPHISSERFKLGPACPAFEAAWWTRLGTADTDLLAADGSRQQVHRLVLQCRLPVLNGQPLPAHATQVCLPCVLDGACLLALVEFLYLDDVQQEALTPQLHQVALYCGLQRLITRCEAHFAHQLEVQLLSWPGLVSAQREDVLDSLIGWALYAEQLDRQELLQLCVHALAVHCVAAQSRPQWSALRESTVSLVALVAASTAPPLIHRQVLADGAVIAPVASNPGPDGAPHAAAPASQGAAQPAVPAASTVSADAEAFAAAGGRMTSWEWQQLQRFRDSVAESRKLPEASPLLLDDALLTTNSLSAAEPGVSFTVKTAVLTPHKRLMDSVCRFAFPATHSLLAAGWQLQSLNSQGAAGNVAGTAGPAAAAPAAAAASGASQTSSLTRALASPAATLQQQQQHAQPQQPAQQQHWLLQSMQPQQHGQLGPSQSQQQQQRQQVIQQAPRVQVPVPVPVLQQISSSSSEGAQGLAPAQHQQAAAAHHLRSSTGSDHGSSGGALQQPTPGSKLPAAPSAAEPGRLSRPGSLVSAAGGSHQGLHGSTHWHSGAALQLRLQAAAGAAAQHLSTDPPASSGPEDNQSWGSAMVPSMHQGSSSMQQQQQQQLLRLPSGCQSWGTGASSHRRSSSSQHATSAATGLSGPVLSELCQQALHPEAGGAGGGAGQRQQPLAGPSTVDEERQRSNSILQACSGTGLLGACAAGQAVAQQQELQQLPSEQQQQQQGYVVQGAEHRAAALQLIDSSVSGGMSRQEHVAPGILELPAAWQPASVNSTAAQTLASSAQTGGHSSMPVGSPSSLPAAVQPADGVQAQPGLAAGAPDGSSGSRSVPHAIAALQRALVEDFVLYEEASAARQHVVGILVAVEQGDAVAGQRLLAPACAELIAATAPAAVPNRLAAHLNSPAVAAAAAAASAAGLPAAQASAAVAAAAAQEYVRQAHGVSRLLGSAAASRAALEASPQQLRQQRVQQQQLLVRALQQVSVRVPWLARLLTPLQQSLDPSTAGRTSAAAAAAGQAATELPALQGSGQQQQSTGEDRMQVDGAVQATAAATAEAAAGQHELQAAVVELIMQLPELLHGLPGPALLTHEQYKQRHTQAQQLAAHAMQLLLPCLGNTADAAAAVAAAADGVAAELAASGLLAAASAALAASPAGGPGEAAGSPGQHHVQAGQLFATILDSLRAPAPGTASDPSTAGVPAQAAAEAALSAAYGARSGGGGAGGFLTRTAAFAAANRLAEGLIRPPSITPPSSLGLSRAGSLAGAGQLGAWRLPASGAAGAAGGLMTPGGMVGGAGMGVFAPTGTGALLSGGLLAEGGVAGDSILDDMLHSNVRRITCHGLYELCAALAQPAGVHSSPPNPPPQQQQQQQLQQVADQQDEALGDSNRTAEGRTLTGQDVAEAVATVVAAAAAIESNRRSSTSSMGPPLCGLAGTKRRLSTVLEEQERPMKH